MNVRKYFCFLSTSPLLTPVQTLVVVFFKKRAFRICSWMVALPASFTGILSLSCNLIHRPVCCKVHKASIYQDFLAPVTNPQICIHFTSSLLIVICKSGQCLMPAITFYRFMNIHEPFIDNNAISIYCLISFLCGSFFLYLLEFCHCWGSHYCNHEAIFTSLSTHNILKYCLSSPDLNDISDILMLIAGIISQSLNSSQY